jgi:cell division septation protein DedD
VDGPVKERLTGALILIAALVIIVPEMLSGPKPDHGSTGAAPAAAADAGPPLRTYNLELSPQATVPAGDQSTPTSAAEPAVPAPAATTAAVAVTPPVAPPPAAVKAPATVIAAASPVATPAPVVSSNKSWWVQLGSFSGRDNAERLARQLRTAGFVMDVSKTRAAGKELYRVRAGPVATREEAVALQGRLAAVGHKASLVAP